MSTKPFILTFVEQATPTADSGLWNHPRTVSGLERTPAYWQRLARTLEASGFDALFLADQPSLGSDRPDQHRHELESGHGAKLDPAYLIPLMAAETQRLGFVITSSVTYDHPYSLARKFATLDHLTRGRIGWNIVTTNARQAALNFSLPDLIEHDLRYDRADEFLEVAYALWNDSWDDDAIIRDRERDVYIDPARVRPISHHGRWFDSEGIPLFSPSPQRTPTLFQAGSSARGREFAARHAEAVYLNATSADETRRLVADVRERAERHGRDPGSIVFLPRIIPVVASTRAEAEAAYEDFVDHHDERSAGFVLRQWAGIEVDGLPDEGEIDLDDLIVEGLTSQGTAEHLRRLSRSGKRFTKRELLRSYAFGGEGNVVVGTGDEVAERLDRFAEETGVDGFNVAYMIRDESLEGFVEHVVPALRARGRLTANADGADDATSTLRERLTGGTAHLPDSHPGRRGSAALA